MGTVPLGKAGAGILGRVDVAMGTSMPTYSPGMGLSVLASRTSC